MRMEEFYTHATRTIGASHENGWRTHRVDRVLGERLDIEGSRWNLGESDQARRRAIRRSSSGRRVNGIGWYRKYFRLWGLSHRDAWRQVETRTFVAATMAWTGFDYRGEPQPLAWPSAGSSFGILDLCGFPKAAYYIRQAQWIRDRPILHLVPHWNWAGSEGKPIKVMAASNAEKVALTLNDIPLGEKLVDKYDMVTFDVPYQAGKLEAVASNSGKVIARFAVETTGPPAALKLVADRDSLAGDGADAQPITVEVVDARGRVVPTASLPVRFTLSGPGAIIGLNDGNPSNHEPEKGDRHSVFHGFAQVIAQSAYAGSGTLTLRATAEFLSPAEVTIRVLPVPPRPAVPPVAR
jgi:beta-galactosidase